MRAQLTLGILAHVDAGKTTLSEAMLYRSGCLRKLGRVDHQDAFLDTEPLERARGITIFSKQAVFPLGEREVTLLDTPGHADFSSEMERALQVLDCAVLVISGTDGVQAHTRTLWRLLARWHVPTFLFVNKMDLPGAERSALLAQLRSGLDEGCVDFSPDQDPSILHENAAMCSEDALEHFLSDGIVPEDELSRLVARRQLFPCWFGSALKLEGVDALLDGLERYAPRPQWPEVFGAKVYKIARDPQGTRLTYLKITGGALRVKQLLTNRRENLDPEAVWEEKADQIRIYSGSKFQTIEEAPAGVVCAVTGLSRTFPGQGLGAEPPGAPPSLEPVLSYRVLLPEGSDLHAALAKLRMLEEEDPQLHVVWRERLREIHIQLMGEVQLAVLQSLLHERFGLEVSFDTGGILYRETITAPVEGVGHYEPLRHYAEVHLLLEPGERGSGLQFAAVCPEDMLEGHWQRLVLTHLEEREHLGVLTGSPITDMKLTLVAGRAHLKHTEGGDFRQATYRAVRQGLMEAESILLEPWYDFRLELPSGNVGRALSDLQRMAGEVEGPELTGEEAILTGRAPVACLRDYAQEVTAYTRGRGRLFCSLRGYAPCHNQEAIVSAIGYDPERDLEQPADSVFCAHGAGYTVKWDQVKDHMHVESVFQRNHLEEEAVSVPSVPPLTDYAGAQALDKELQAIYERTYGPIKRRDLFQPTPMPVQTPTSHDQDRRTISPRREGPEYLLVDGYNIIFAWEELQAVARDSLDTARQLLMDLLSNYQGFKKCVVILVFDAYKVPRGLEEVIRYHNIYVVYTKEAETADAYIEKTTFEIGKRHRVKVATSDGTEQLIILGHGALRLSASAFRAEVEQVEGEIADILAQNNRREKTRPIQAAMDQAKGRRRPS